MSGATKLLDSLTVYGKLGVLSDAVFGKDVTLTNGNLIIEKGTIKISNMTLVKNLNAEYLDGIKKGEINLQFVTSNGNTTTKEITIGGLNVNGTGQFNGVGFFNSGVWGSTGSFGSLGVAGDVSIGKKDNPDKSRFEVYSKYFSVNNVGNTSISGRATTGDLLVGGSILSNLIPSGSFDLGSSGSPWNNLFVIDGTCLFLVVWISPVLPLVPLLLTQIILQLIRRIRIFVLTVEQLQEVPSLVGIQT